MCEDTKLKLIPVVIIVAAVLSGLVIFANTPAGLFILFAAALGIAFVILIVTGIIAAACGFRRTLGEPCNSRSSITCFLIRCYGPIILITSVISVIAALLVIEGAFALFSGLINAILGIVFAIIFSIMLVYFAGMFLNIIERQD
jgi:hypothetical protein